jgi:hypothetical protein
VGKAGRDDGRANPPAFAEEMFCNIVVSIPIETPTTHTKTIRELYPTLSERELKEAEANLLRYFEIALDIHEEQSSPDVDTSPPLSTMKERSKSLKN